MWIEREIKSKIKRALETKPVLLVTGARQTGKSSLLVREIPEAEYVTLDKVSLASEAEDNPELFLKRFKREVILDEIQYAPSLFRELKILIDKNRRSNGQWILTGSQQFSLMKNVGESLAGRIRILHLGTLSAKELRGSGYFSNSQIEECLWKGGFPELWAVPGLVSEEFFEDYIQTYLERDLRLLINISSLKDFQRFLRICASRAGQLINFSDMARDVGVSNNTIKAWLNALETSGILYILPPYYENLGKRLIKAPKIYFSDNGLLSNLLNISDSKSFHKHVYRGQIWENFVFSELIKTYDLIPGKNIFFYRDQNGVEIDFIVEHKDKIHLIEAKTAENFDNTKLNFQKVNNIMRHRDVNNVLACFSRENSPVRLAEYNKTNPLFNEVLG